MRLKPIICILSAMALVSLTEQTEDQLQNSDKESSQEKPLIVRSVDKEKGLPKETQMAQCTITSGDIKASAQATFSKKLEGFCSTKDMTDLKENLARIEARLHDELYYLKLMIQDLLPRNSHYNQPRQRYYQDNYYQNSYNPPNQREPQPSYNQNNVHQTFTDKPIERPNYTKNVTTQKPIVPTTQQPFKQPEVVMRDKLKSLESNKSRIPRPTEQTTSTTQAPITTTTSAPEPVPATNEYTYYWRLENFPKVFLNAKKNEVFSHVFNVKGLFLRVRAILRQFEDQNLILDIEHLANVEKADKMEIEISDGGLVFQEIAEEKLFQYSFAIMDQSKPNHDLISPVYWNTETDNFLVPNSIHLLANYIKNDSLLIKLIIIF